MQFKFLPVYDYYRHEGKLYLKTDIRGLNGTNCVELVHGREVHMDPDNEVELVGLEIVSRLAFRDLQEGELFTVVGYTTVWVKTKPYGNHNSFQLEGVHSVHSTEFQPGTRVARYIPKGT